MGDVFRRVSEISPQRIWSGVSGRAIYADGLTLAIVELDAGSAIPEHQHINEQVGVLVQGSVTFRVGDQERRLTAGATWCIPANAPHEVRVGRNGAVIIETFAPPREDWRMLEHLPDRKPRWPA